MIRKFVFAMLASVVAVSAFATQHPGRRAQRRGVVVSKRGDIDARAFEQQEAVARQSEPRYQGLTVLPHPDAIGVDRGLQEQIGALMGRLDFVPDERLARFRWLDRYESTLTGWDARIEEVTPAPGGVRVKVSVYPKHTKSWLAAVNGHAVEYYYYSQNQIQYLQSEERPTPIAITIN